MDVKEAIYGRRSIRKFKQKKIPSKLLREIINAGLQAPASCNQQMYSIILVEDGKLKRRLHNEAHFKLIPRMPHVMFVICDKRFGNERFANIQGTAAVIHNMTLYAFSKGIGSLWMAGYGDKAIVKELLSIPQHYHILGAVGLGYSDEDPLPPVKADVDEIVFKNKFTSHQKNAKNPNDWEEEDIVNIATRSIFAKSPDIGYKHLFPLEIKQEINYISPYLSKNVLSIYDISGLYLYELAKRNPDVKFTSLVWKEFAREWLEERAKFLGLKNLKFVCKDIKDVKAKYSTILLLDFINRSKDKQISEVLEYSKNILTNNGKIIMSSLNRKSIYGLLFRKGVTRRYGPEISLSNKKVKIFIDIAALNINDRRGFNPLPSPRLFFKTGVPGRYTVFNKYMRFLSKFDLLEGKSYKGILKNFCTLNIFVLEK